MANESATTVTDKQADLFQRFQNFLKSFRTESGSLKYRETIQRLPVTGERSVVIDYNELLDFDPQLARQILDEPEDCFKTAAEAVKTIVDLEDRDYVTKITDSGHEFKARLKNVTTGKVKLRMIRASHIGKLIMVDGIITRVSEVKPQLIVATFECSCGQKVFTEQFEGRFTPPVACPACRREGPFNLVVEESKFIDWQKIRIQEMPEELPPGQMPRSLDAIIKDDLVDVARPGDRVAIIGVLMSVQDFAPKRGRLTTFRTYIDSNYVDTMDKESEKVEITPEEERFIIDLAKDEWIHQKIIKSIAPSIYGLEDVKEAIALALFGGVAKTLPDGVKIRGEINVLLVGDPGTAKSVHGTEKVYVGRECGSTLRWNRESIGSLVDSLMSAHQDEIVVQGNSEILPLRSSATIFTQTMDPISLKTRSSLICEVSRHRTDQLVRIHTRSGRTVLATPDHSFTTIIDGKLQVIFGQDLRPGTYLPIARQLDLEEGSSYIDLANEFQGRDLVSAEEINTQIVLIQSQLVSARAAATICNISANTMGGAINRHVSIPNGAWLRRKTDTTWFPRWLELGPELGRIVGLYLAEGNVERTTVRFSACSDSIRNALKSDLETVFGKFSMADKAILLCQSSLATWFEQKFGTGAENKRIPAEFFTAPYSLRLSLLSGYFSGDGTIGMKGSAVQSTTKSRTLAYQLSDLLATVGIFATINKVTVTKGPYKGRTYHQVRIQGTDLLTFHKQVRLISTNKQDRLELIVKRMRARKRYQSRDMIPNYGSMLVGAARELGMTSKRGSWTRNFIAELRGKKKRQHVGRVYLQKVISRLSSHETDSHAPPCLDWLRTLAESDVFWDQVTKVDLLNERTTVYDIGTSNGHFILAEGNLIVHNSQLLMYTAGLAPRGLYTSGKGSTAAGLTAAVLRDADTGDMTLEAGALVLADRGVACLHPSTKVLFNGKIARVDSLFNEGASTKVLCGSGFAEICPVRGYVNAVDPARLVSVVDHCSLVRRRRHVGRLVVLKLASGFELKLTEDHKLIDGDTLQWRDAGHFGPGETVLSPLKLPGVASPTYIFDLIPDDWVVGLTREEKQDLRGVVLGRFKTLSEFNRFFGVSRQILSGRQHFKAGKLREILAFFDLMPEWREKTLRYIRKSSGAKLKINKVTPELAYLIGFAYGDGSFSTSRRRSRIQVSQSLKKKEIIANLKHAVHSITYSKLGQYSRTSISKIRGKAVISDNAVLYVGSNLLTNIANYFLRDDLGNLLKLQDECLEAFIAGAFDADGCASIKHGTKGQREYQTVHVEFKLSANREKDLAFILALRRLDVYAKLLPRHDVNIISMTGREDVVKFLAAIRAYSIKAKQFSIPRRLHMVSSASGKLPSQVVARICRTIADGSKKELLDKGIWSAVYAYMNSKYQPSRDQLIKIRDSMGRQLPIQLADEISRLVKRDYFLDKIVSVKYEDYDSWVYDLYVANHHNFLGNGVWMHNCVDEFDKMNPQDRVAIHQAMEQQSYHPLTEVALADGTRTRIGMLVDSLFLEHRGDVVQGVNCEILDGRPLDVEVFSTDFRRVEQVHVDRLSRHPAPDHFFRIVLSNGREIVVTPDHPFFVFKGATITTMPAAEIEIGDFVPGFRLMPCGHNPGAVLTRPASAHFNAKTILLPETMTPKLARLLGYFVSEGFTHFGASAELGFSNTSDPIIDDITALTRELFGLEGANYIDRDRTIRYVSAQLRDLFKLNFPQILVRAAHKRAPPQLFTSGRLAAMAFLQSAFLGDGSVEPESVCYRTSSHGLACDYQDLLLCVGIQSRIAHDTFNDSYKVYICGASLPLFYSTVVESWDPRRDRMAELASRSEVTNRNHDVFPPGIGVRLKRLYQEVGRGYRGTFHWAIKNRQGITRLLLKSCLAEVKDAFSKSMRMLDMCPKTVKNARQILNWSQDTTALRIGATRSFIDYAERNGYSPEIRQDLVATIMRAVLETCDSIESEIKKLDSLLENDLCFLRVRKAERIENKGKWFCPFVYDVTVEPNHCFISHGAVLHNTISIAKAGIVATLNARTAILAAANPALGRYNSFKNPAENINLPVTVLSRFDLIFVMVDKPESERDRKMAEHVISLHSSKATGNEAPISPQLLRKYISYAKKNTPPRLTNEAASKIQEFYLETRAMGENPESPVPITARQLEALVRLAESRAKMALKKEITVDDAEAVIRLMTTSLKMVGIDRETMRADIDTIMVGRTKTQRERVDLIITLVRELGEGSKEGFVQIERIVDAAGAQGVERQFALDTINRLIKEGVLFEPRQGIVKKA